MRSYLELVCRIEHLIILNTMASTHIIRTTNKLLSHCGVDRRVQTVSQCNSQLFIELYEALTGSHLPGLRPRPPSSETLRYQALVSGIAGLVHPHVTLEHIRGLELARQDLVALSNLLDILCVLSHLPLSSVCGGNRDSSVCGGNGDSRVCGENGDSSVHGGDSIELNDSNVVSAEGRQIIEEVLERELEVHSPLLTPCAKTSVSPLHHSTPHVPPRSHICPATSGDTAQNTTGSPSFSVSPASSSSPQAVVSLSRHIIDQSRLENRNYVLMTMCNKFLRENRNFTKQSSKPKQQSSVRDAPNTASAATDDLFPALKEALPFIHTSPATLHHLWQKQAAQVAALHRPPSCITSDITKNVMKMEQKHKSLLKLLEKDLELTHRLQRQHEHRQQQAALRAAVQAKRQATARARRYYDEYELQLQAKLQKRRSREEQVFCRVFEEGLAIQRQRAAEMRRYAKERERAEAQRQHTKLQSLEKYFQDQFAMLADAVAREKKELELREKAQTKLADQLRREARGWLEKQVRSLQEGLGREEDIAHFRSLDAERLRHEWSTS